jgi:hypothetical protein
LHTLSAASAWLAAASALSLQGVGFLLLRSTAAAAAAAGLAGVQLAEALAAVLAVHLLKGAPPMTRTAVLGSARVVRSMMAEALRQTWLLAAQLYELHARAAVA